MAVLTPQPKMQFVTAAGVPLSGGKVYTYTAGTTTPLATFTDSSGATPNANPIILDSRGEAAIWLGSASYKFKLTDANDVEIWTVDYISAPTSGISPVLSGNVTIDSDTPGPALKITQTGTGPVLRVQDSADPDTTPFIIDTSGNLGLGTPTPTVQLEATGAAKIGSLTLTSAPLPVTSGGTGAADAANARANLSAASTGAITASGLTQATSRLLGRTTAGAGAVEELSVSGLLLSGGSLSVARDRQIFSSAGANTWTKPSGFASTAMVLLEAWGAGGSGGRQSVGGGGGGGGGSYVYRWVTLADLGATETVTVGTGGASRTGTNQAGAAGGNTTIGSLLTGYGGGGGDAGLNQAAGGGGWLGAGTVSAVGAGYAVSYGGGSGGTCDGSAATAGNAAVYGGGGGAGGGSTLARSGGTSLFGGAGGASSATGTAGTQPGGGGGAGSTTSGAGGNGRAIITIFG